MKDNVTFTFHLTDGDNQTQIKINGNSIKDAERYFNKHFRPNYRNYTIIMVLPDFCKIAA